MRQIATGNYVRTAAGQGRYSGNYINSNDRHWWNEYRLARLTYIMDRWNDTEKAARVLGCYPQQAQYHWGALSEERKQALRETVNYR